MESMAKDEIVELVRSLRERVSQQLHRRIVGQQETIDLLLVTLLSRGHCMVTGVPGLAKTLLVRSLSGALELDFSRIQFTPDLMPSDITGTEVIQEDRATGRREFSFVKGPIFSNLLLADEVNRTPPKTQAALLQAMQEGQVTVMGKTWSLAPPFHVLATQNPIEQEGTYPLPEALLDRFLLSINMDYPSVEEEQAIVLLTRVDEIPIEPVLDGASLLRAQRLVDQVPVTDNIARLVVRLVRSTRPGKEAPDKVNDYVLYGAGPRAAQCLLTAARAWALLSGKPAPMERHVVEMAPAVLQHRLVLNFRADTERVHRQDLVLDLVRKMA